MSNWVIRRCSRSCQGENGTPAGAVPWCAAPTPATAASKPTWPSSQPRSFFSCARSGLSFPSFMELPRTIEPQLGMREKPSGPDHVRPVLVPEAGKEQLLLLARANPEQCQGREPGDEKIHVRR